MENVCETLTKAKLEIGKPGNQLIKLDLWCGLEVL